MIIAPNAKKLRKSPERAKKWKNQKSSCNMEQGVNMRDETKTVDFYNDILGKEYN